MNRVIIITKEKEIELIVKKPFSKIFINRTIEKYGSDILIYFVAKIPLYINDELKVESQKVLVYGNM